MNKKLFLIFLSVMLLALVGTKSAYGQLLEDRNKLKTSKRDRKSFSPFKKNVKKPSKKGSKPDVVKPWPVRTSKDKAGQQGGKYYSPRYTQDRAGQQGGKFYAPRYSQENAGQQGGKFSKPRYTQEHAGKQDRKFTSPRYTQEHAGQQGGKFYEPRYTQEHAGQGYDKVKVNPRFTIRDKSKNKPVRPRYSKPPAYVTNPASGQRKGFMPTIQLFQPKPRYKQGKESQFFGPSVKPVYRSSNSMAKHNKSIESYQKHIAKGGEKGPYHDQTSHLVKTKKMKKPKNAHPSANYLSAKYNNSASVRNSKRKFNITWVRTFGNKTQPKGVKKKPEKSKFDKDEKDIWNNKEREYTRN